MQPLLDYANLIFDQNKQTEMNQLDMATNFKDLLPPNLEIDRLDEKDFFQIDFESAYSSTVELDP